MLAISIANIAVLATPFICIIGLLIETLLGIVLLEISFLIKGVEIDFRYILYSVSMKYLGWKVTLPTMLLLSVYGFLFQGVEQPLNHLFMILLICFIMYHLVKIMERKKVKEFTQLLILTTYNALIASISIYHTVAEIEDVFLFYLPLVMKVFSVALQRFTLLLHKF